MSKMTIYNIDDDSYSKVEEPDSSLTYTYADYLQWQFEERLELFRGKIFKLSAPNTRHQQISLTMGSTFHSFFKSKKCQAFIAPFDVRLPVKNKKKDDEVITVVQPDICVICDETKIDTRGCCGAPDLVVEILSPGNSKKEIRLKYELYEEAGVKEYWIVNPDEENIVVFLLNEEEKFSGLKMYASGDTIESIAVPGLNINLTEIFTK
ncbi:MAG: Uma2 family endonuclease [Chitinophagaceae bacterium]|nr:Uma2 family endonuclease [Chitinophagaceae bacterium]